MQIDLWPIERVIPYDRNPRQNDQAVDAVAASLREFGAGTGIQIEFGRATPWYKTAGKSNDTGLAALANPITAS